MNAKIHSLSIFFPCYNDAGTIASMVILANRVAREFTEDYEIIVVDDGSRDGSREVLDELQSILPDRIKLVLHDKNRGYGGALRSGFATASKEWVFYTDGDAQYDPRELRELIKKVSEEVDVVQGYKIKRHDPWYRILIGELYRLSMKVLFSLKIRDVDCDFRLIRRSVLQKFHLTQDSGVICLELVKKLHMAEARFTEVGVTHHFRAYGHSQFFNFGRIARVGIGVLKLWWELVIRREGV